MYDTNDDGGAGSCSPSPVTTDDSDDGCPYALVMEDSWGDGWNGAYWEWFDADGVKLDSGTLETGVVG